MEVIQAEQQVHDMLDIHEMPADEQPSDQIEYLHD